jgi:hypothetical protein
MVVRGGGRPNDLFLPRRAVTQQPFLDQTIFDRRKNVIAKIQIVVV